MYFTHEYVINWDKVQTVDDIKRILKVVDISFNEDCEHLDTIKDLVTRAPKSGPYAVLD